METIRVNMAPCEDVQTIHASQNDNEAREWGFELHNNGEKIDSSSISDQLVFKAYEGGTEEILPTNGSTPTTSPFLGDIKYPQGLLTDQEFLYRQSPTEEDGNAKIKSLYGNTLVWNQLVQNGNFASTNGWTVYQPANASINANSNVLTETLTISTLTQGAAYTIGLQKTNVISDATHKYLCFVTITLSFTSNVRIELGGSAVLTTNPINANTKTTLSVVSTAYTYNKNLLIYPQSGVVGIDLSGQTLKYENIMLIDLTLMFGAGNEPSTVEEFISLFPLSYYPYDSGSLIPFMGNGIKTVGKNIFSGEQSYTRTSTGYYIREGNTSNPIPLKLAKGTYTISIKSTVSGISQLELFSGGIASSDRYIAPYISLVEGVKKYTFTIEKQCDYIRLYGNFIGTISDIQIEFGSTATSYEPYTSSTLSLPISTYFPNGMKSAGNVYDELTETKATTRIGSITLNGSEAWIKSASYQGNYYVLGLLSNAKYPNPTAVSNRLHLVYNTTQLSANDLCFMFDGSANSLNVNIKNTSMTTLDQFKAWLQANPVTIYYELATPTETSFTTASLVTENAEIHLSNEDGVLIGKCIEQLSADAGFIEGKIKLSDEDGDVYSNKIQIHVERSPQ